MDFLKEFISVYGITILYSILTAIVGYLGIVVKNLYQKHLNDKTKQDVAKTCVKAVEKIIRICMARKSYRKHLNLLLKCLQIRVSPLQILNLGC